VIAYGRARHARLAAAHTAADREMFQRQIDATDAQINALVYALYGSTEEEIRIVEGAWGRGIRQSQFPNGINLHLCQLISA